MADSSDSKEERKAKQREKDRDASDLGKNGEESNFWMSILKFFLKLFLGEGAASFFSGFSEKVGSTVSEAGSGIANKARDVTHSITQGISQGWDKLKAKFVSDMPSDKTYVSAEKSGRDIVYHTADGAQVVKVRSDGAGGSLSWANNNPGNMENGSFAKAHGAIGTDGRFAVFPTVEAGFAAQISLLNKRYNDLTLSQAIHKWCPFGDGDNNPTLYASRVSQKTGLDQNMRVGDMTTEQLNRMAHAMADQEGWVKGKVAVVDNGKGTTVASAKEPSVERTSVARKLDEERVASNTPSTLAAAPAMTKVASADKPAANADQFAARPVAERQMVDVGNGAKMLVANYDGGNSSPAPRRILGNHQPSLV